MPLRKRIVSRTDAEWIRLKGEEAHRAGRPMYVAHEQRPGWTEALPLYLWWCPDCQDFTVAHPAGYGRLHCRLRPWSHRVQVPSWRRFRDQEFPGLAVLLVGVGVLAVFIFMLVSLIR